MPRYAVQVTRTEWTSTVVFVEAVSVEDAEEQAQNEFDEQCGFDMDIDDSETEPHELVPDSRDVPTTAD